ncbi:beta strand repeat-containing protein, partial [Castellaniella sp. S9]|uniref:beta strand repeat-containing protein n=1 Tax=Castellaniella sp. S9 TaxID=2993652 RepID=UPI0022B42480
GVSATSTDAAGNATTTTTTHGYAIDTTAPALTVSVDSITSDNVINAAESGAETTAVTGTVVAEDGTSTTVTITVNGQQYAATVDVAAGTWTADIATSDLVADSSVGVSATSTDAAGNATTTTATHDYAIDTTAPELTITVDSITADNVVNAAESGASVDVTGAVDGEFNAGDTVTLTVNNTEYTGTIAANGSWAIAVAGSDLAASDSLDVSVTTTDAAGNSTTTTTSHSYSVDVTAPELTVAVDPVTSDNVINVAESGASVDITGAVTGEFNEGDTITLTVNGTEYVGTAGEGGAWTIAVAGSDLAAATSLEVSVTTTDAAGNSTTQTTTHSYGVDTTAPALTVSVDPITSDNVINVAESGAETIAVTGAVVTEAGTETTVTVTVNGQEYTATVDVAAGTWTVDVATDDLLADSSVAVSATSTDTAGNATTTTATHGYSVDVEAPELTVLIDPITSDNVINAAESGASVDVTGAVTGEYNAGDAVTLTVNDTEHTGTVAADGTWTIAVAGSDLAATDSLIVSVTTIDAAGNGTTQVATHSYGVDTTAPELTVSVDSITADNVINAAESGAEMIAVTGSVSAEAGTETTVTVTVNGQQYAATVDVTAGTWTVDVATSDLLADSSVGVSATSTDAAGNSTTTSTTHTYSIDTTAPELAVSVDPITSDNVINAAESGASVDVTGAVDGEFSEGDAVTLTVNGTDYIGAVAADGTWTIAVAGSDLAASDSLAVSVTTADVAGNSTTTTSTHGYGVDTAAPELAVSVDPVTTDNVINTAESGAETIAVTGAVVTEAGTETTVTVTVNGQEYTATVDVAAGTWTVDVATSDLLADSTVAVGATSTDAAGNATTTAATHSYGVDTTAPELTVLVDPITSDNVINAAESGASVDVTGAVSGEFNEGDAVTLTVNGTEYVGTAGEGGAWTITVAGSDLAAATSLEVSVTTTDAAGNGTTVSSTHAYSVDVAAPELTVSVDSITSDNVVNAAESAASVDVTGTVTGEFNAGDTVTLTINGTEYTGAVGEDGAWTIAVAGSDLAAATSLDVSVTTTDAAGNSTTVTSSHSYGVDTIAPELTVSVDPVTTDNVINIAESGAETIAVTGAVTAEAGAETTITVTVNGQQYAATVDAAAGTWTVDVATSDLLADSAVAVSATSTDAAGNATTTSATHGYSVDTDAPELTVSVDPITPDNVINAAESSGLVNVAGKVTGEFSAGDTVTLTVNDTEYTGVAAADGTWAIAVAGTDLAVATAVDVSVTTTDAAGNSTTTTTSHAYGVDTTAPDLTIAVDSITNDNVVNAAESGAAVAVTGAVNGEFNEGDAVTLMVNDTEYTGAVAADGSWTIAVAGSDLAATDSLTVSVTTTDAAGNSTTQTTTHSYGVDTTAPELTVSVDSITADNVINAAESGAAVDVTGTVIGEYNAGDAVTLTVNDIEYTGAVAADGTWAIAVAGTDLAAATSLDVSVTTADAA